MSTSRGCHQENPQQGFLQLHPDWAKVSQTFSSTVIIWQQTTDNHNTLDPDKRPFYLLAVKSAPLCPQKRERRHKNHPIPLLPVLMIPTNLAAFLLNRPAKVLDHREAFQHNRHCEKVACRLQKREREKARPCHFCCKKQLFTKERRALNIILVTTIKHCWNLVVTIKWATV